MANIEIDTIIDRLKEKDTRELAQILDEHNLDEWTEEAFLAIDEILLKRNETLNRIRNYEKQKNVDSLIEIIVSKLNNIFCSDDERKRAAMSLGRIKKREVVPKLLEVAKDLSIEEFTRKLAIFAIGETSSSEAVDELISFLVDYNEDIRNEALMALKKINKAMAIHCELCQKSFMDVDIGKSFVWIVAYFKYKDSIMMEARDFERISIWSCQECYSNLSTKKKFGFIKIEERAENKLKYISRQKAEEIAFENVKKIPFATHIKIFTPDEFENEIAYQKSYRFK